VPADVGAQVAPAAADGHGGKAHLREARPRALDDVELLRAVRAARGQERDRRRRTRHELALVEHARAAHRARGALPAGALAAVGGDVGVAVQVRECKRDRERRQLLARLDPREPPPLLRRVLKPM
jgi:hypothetical protein